MLKHQLLIDSPVVFRGNFRKANVGDKGDNGIIVDTYGSWESLPLPRPLCSSTRMAPGRGRSRQGDPRDLDGTPGRARSRQGDPQDREGEVHLQARNDHRQPRPLTGTDTMVSFHPLKRNSSTIQLSVLIAHEENVAKTPNRHLFASTISQSKAHCQAIVGPFAVITTSSMHATERTRKSLCTRSTIPFYGGNKILVSNT